MTLKKCFRDFVSFASNWKNETCCSFSFWKYHYPSCGESIAWLTCQYSQKAIGVKEDSNSYFCGVFARPTKNRTRSPPFAKPIMLFTSSPLVVLLALMRNNFTVIWKSLCIEMMAISIFFFLQSSASEWRVVFYIGGLIYIVGAIFYCVFASGNKQTWVAGYSELTETDDDDDEVDS